MGKVFKTVVFGGFKKWEVIEYLDGLSKKQKADETRFAEETLALENQLAELKAKLEESEARCLELDVRLDAQTQAYNTAAAGLDAELAEVREGLEATLGEQTVLRSELEGLRAERAALSEENAQMRSRILHFDDERSAFEGDAAEQRSQLERRVFDLEAEALEALAQKAASERQLADCQLAERRQTEAVEAVIEQPTVEQPAAERPSGRIVVRRRGQAVAQPEHAPEQAGGRLNSVRDILRFVRGKDSEEN